MNIKCLLAAAVVLVLLSGPSFADLAYTIEDVNACSQDAMKLCRDKLPDLEAIQICMKANYASLHAACQARFDRDK